MHQLSCCKKYLCKDCLKGVQNAGDEQSADDGSWWQSYEERSSSRSKSIKCPACKYRNPKTPLIQNLNKQSAEFTECLTKSILKSIGAKSTLCFC